MKFLGAAFGLLVTRFTCHGFLQPTSLSFSSSSSFSSLQMVSASESSQLAQLAGMTTLSIDSGDLKVIEELAKTGYITDATTNPLFVSQAGLSGDPVYAEVRPCIIYVYIYEGVIGN